MNKYINETISKISQNIVYPSKIHFFYIKRSPVSLLPDLVIVTMLKTYEPVHVEDRKCDKKLSNHLLLFVFGPVVCWPLTVQSP